jgi:hypothetical protein
VSHVEAFRCYTNSCTVCVCVRACVRVCVSNTSGPFQSPRRAINTKFFSQFIEHSSTLKDKFISLQLNELTFDSMHIIYEV